MKNKEVKSALKQPHNKERLLKKKKSSPSPNLFPVKEEGRH